MRNIEFKAGTTAPPFRPSWDHPPWRQEYSTQVSGHIFLKIKLSYRCLCIHTFGQKKSPRIWSKNCTLNQHCRWTLTPSNNWFKTFVHLPFRVFQQQKLFALEGWTEYTEPTTTIVYQFSNAMTSTQYKKPVPGVCGPLKREQVYGVDTQHNRHGFMPFMDYYF